MRYINQRDDETCGVAAVATAAGVSFERAQEVMEWDEGKHDFTSLVMLVGALHCLGVKCGRALNPGTRPLETLKFDAIINFRAPGRKFYDSHRAVWDAEKEHLHDPYWVKDDWTDHPYSFLKFTRPIQ